MTPYKLLPVLLLLGVSAYAAAPPPVVRNSYTTNSNPVLSGDGGALVNLKAAAISGVINPVNLPPASGGVEVVVAGGTQLYVSPGGSTTNTGLTVESPWTMAKGVANLGPDVTVNMLPGVYAGGIMIYNITNGTAGHPATIKSMVKWGAVVANSANYGIAFGFTPFVSYVVIDGLCISNNLGADGIGMAGNHLTVRNCWIVKNWMQGVNSSHFACSNNVIEYNLIENNGRISFGTTDAHYHGAYVVGPNNIVRGNVIRNNGSGYGIQVYTEDAGVYMDKTWVYNNVIYGHTNSYGLTIWGAVDGGQNPGTNYILNNTVLDGIQLRYGTANVSNNIVLPSPRAIYDPLNIATGASAPVVNADYNLGTNAIVPNGGHNILTADPGFVSRANGLFWLASASPARGAALPRATGPNSFFGILRASVTDIGAVQYLDALTFDGRKLDPSPTYGADYWATPLQFVPLVAAGAGAYTNGQVAATNSAGQWVSFGTASGESTIEFDNQQVRVGHLAGQFATNNSVGATMVGNQSGRFASNAPSATFVGYSSGSLATNAYDGVFLGDSAGQIAINAKESVFVGLDAGQFGIAANDAVLIGPYAGNFATNASYAVMIGDQTGLRAANADEAVMLGNVAGQWARDAEFGVFVGTQAGRYATNASASIYIGEQAGRDVNRPNTLIIDSQLNRANTTNAFLYGEFDTGKLALNGRLYVANGVYGNGNGLTNLALSISGTNATPPVNTSNILYWANVTLPDGSVLKTPLYK